MRFGKAVDLIIEGVLILAAILIGAILGGWFMGWASMRYFDYAYPDDGQSALGVVFVALLSGAFSGAAILFSALYWRWAQVTWFHSKAQELGDGARAE